MSKPTIINSVDTNAKSYRISDFVDINKIMFKAILVTGNSGTGKTVLIKHLLVMMSAKCPSIFVITPQGSMNNYTMINTMFKRTTLDENFLRNLLLSQEKKSSFRRKIIELEPVLFFALISILFDDDTYNDILNDYNDITNLDEKKIYLNEVSSKLLLDDREKLDLKLQTMQVKLRMDKNELKIFLKKLRFLKFYVDYDKTVIGEFNFLEYINELTQESEDQLDKALIIADYLYKAFLNLVTNINAVLVIEDMTHLLGQLQKVMITVLDDNGNPNTSNVMSEILTRSRHFNLSLIVVAHSLDKINNRSSYGTIIMSDISQYDYLMRNDIKIHTKDKDAICAHIFKGGTPKHTKIIVIRDNVSDPEYNETFFAFRGDISKIGDKNFYPNLDNMRNILLEIENKKSKNFKKDI